MLKDLGRRTFGTCISIGAVIVLLWLSYHQYARYVVALSIGALGSIAVWEYNQFAKAKGGKIILPAVMALSFVVIISFFAAAQLQGFSSLPPICFFIGLLCLFAMHFRQNDGAIIDLSASSFALLYIAVPLGMVLSILYLSPLVIQEDGRWWTAYLLVVTKITDVGAYFAGSLWGKRKLAPQISPGKTIEGALFGLLCAVGASFLFHWINEYSGAHHFQLGTLEWLLLGLILGVTGQFGDLAESLLKRDAKKKDSNALPGLGGILDSLDSLLFNAPIIYFYLQHIKS